MSLENPGEEVNELREHAEQAEHTKMIEVSFTMSVLAVLLAAATLLGHRSHTEEGILSVDRSDQWNFYQAKKQRGVLSEQFVDNLAVLETVSKDEKTHEVIEGLKKKYEKRIEKANDDTKDISGEAKKIEDERKLITRKADRFDLAEGFLEVALVICSLTLLTSNRIFWFAGMAIGAAGVVIALLGVVLH
jgi:hypothetical protein